MFTILNPGNDIDRSPFQWAKTPYLSSRLSDNQKAYRASRQDATGRIDSNHLLSTILNSIDVQFNGDLFKYMADCEAVAKRLCNNLGITSAWGRGDIFRQGVFYPGCPEIIMHIRNPRESVLDLWGGWKMASPISVLMHPVSSLVLFEPCVTNQARLSHTGLAIITIDIPLMATQHLIWQSANPGETVEKFITSILLPNMMMKHHEVTLFNKIQVELGIKPECDVNTNLNMMQSEVDVAGLALAKEAVEKISSKAMTPNMTLNSIPSLYNGMLNSLKPYGALPNFQMDWALIVQKTEMFGVAMEFCKRFGYDKALREITVARRTAIDIRSDKTLSNGLTTAASDIAMEHFTRLVVQQLPT